MTKIDVNLRENLIAESRHFATVFANKAESLAEECKLETQPKRRALISEVSKIFASLSIDHARLARQHEIDSSVPSHHSSSPTQ